MYSRFPDSSGRPIRVPEHYSGVAFSERPPRPPEPLPKKRLPEVATPSPPKELPPSKEPPALPVPRLLPPPPQEPPHPREPIRQPLLGLSVPFLRGIGFEELLLLGLILLLAQSEEDPSTVLWLALLLFCG